MTQRLLTTAFALVTAFTALATAQESTTTTLLIRSVLNDPAQPEMKFFTGKPGDAMVALKLVAEGFGEPQKVQAENGNLYLFSTATVDKNNPQASLLATIKVPTGAAAAGSLIVIILPSPKGTATPYSGIAIGDDARSFPWGESKAINLTPVEFAIEAGEHKLPLPPGKVTAVPKVTKVNEYNIAQTNFYYKQDNQWVIAAERQMQYANTLRRVFLIYKGPEAVAPDVRTILDRPPAVFDDKKK